jgi:hypothetical protein
MIARFTVLLPIKITIPEGEPLTPETQTTPFGRLAIYPPMAAATSLTSRLFDPAMPLMNLADKVVPAAPQAATSDVLLNDRKTTLANLLLIEYRKDSFVRDSPTQERAPDDPPVEHAFAVFNGLLRRIRSATQAARIREVTPVTVIWRCEYLNDDGTPLVPDDRYIRVRTAVAFNFEGQALLKQHWDKIHTLPVDYAPPIWETLLLDAELMLPQVGPALVLAFASIETIASATMNHLAGHSPTPASLWEWLNARGPWKDPTIDEQCGDLLKVFVGRSLKDNALLWQAFKNLATVRNRFVHEGVATLGGKAVTEVECTALLAKAKEVIEFLEQFLPEPMRRPLTDVQMLWKSTQLLRAPGDGADRAKV